MVKVIINKINIDKLYSLKQLKNLIGTIFIAVGFYRIINYHLTNSHHIGYEASILYWHMVDVVWLFLFIAVYYWGGN